MKNAVLTILFSFSAASAAIANNESGRNPDKSDQVPVKTEKAKVGNKFFSVFELFVPTSASDTIVKKKEESAMPVRNGKESK
jgi:hypothetical protein